MSDAATASPSTQRRLSPSVPTQMLVAGGWRDASDGAVLEVINPATEELLASVPSATEADVDAAVRAARSQFDDGPWSRMAGGERRAILRRLAALLEENRDLLAEVESINNGKVAFEPAVLDVPNAIETIDYFAGWADKIEGRTIPTAGYFGRPTLHYTVREAVGVIGAIIPWNTPLMIACWKIAPALAAGCTVVMKVAEEAPLSTLLLAKLAQEAGLPDGVLNVLTGVGEVAGAALVRHPMVDKVSFTGSPEVGRTILREAAGSFKKVALELGGKSPQIVLRDADVEAALRGCTMGVFFNQGQVCAAGTRIFVERPLFEEFSEALSGLARGIKVGDPANADTTMGAMISRAQRDRVADYVAIGREEGARVIAGGSVIDGPGFFHQPTIFTGVTNEMRIAREEIFGPVAAIIPIDGEDDAVRQANDSVYGLAATVWTRDIAAGHRVAGRIRAGSVSVNGWATIGASLPWGGVKQSGLGRELGWNGIEACTEEKLVSVVL
jgi:phenylacetaldehyde dehydrogenase